MNLLSHPIKSDAGSPTWHRNPQLNTTQTKIIELLREVHLLACTEIERLNRRIVEFECQSRASERTVPYNQSASVPCLLRHPWLLRYPRLRNRQNEHDVAAYLKISVSSLRRWRLLRTGPKFVKIGAAVRYRQAEVKAWLDGIN